MKLVLKGKTTKGKNRVRELGENAEVVKETDKILFSDDMGTWAFIRPHERWVNLKSDIDFEIKITEY